MAKIEYIASATFKIDVVCEHCGTEYSYQRRFGVKAPSSSGAKANLQKEIVRRQAENDWFHQRCTNPECGYMQSWMIPDATRSRARQFRVNLLWIVPLLFLCVGVGLLTPLGIAIGAASNSQGLAIAPLFISGILAIPMGILISQWMFRRILKRYHPNAKFDKAYAHKYPTVTQIA